MQHFRELLQQEFIRRTNRNKSYSLRAFAQQLGMNHATLSGLLSGKRTVTANLIDKLTPALELDPKKVAELKSANPESGSQEAFHMLQQDAFNSMSEWYFDAILELSQIPNINLSPKVIAPAISITELQAKLALETLERLELLKLEKGRYRLEHANSTNILDPDYSTVAQRKYQRSVLEKSIEALTDTDRKERDHTSTTMAIQKKDLGRAKELIKKFRTELNAFLQRDPKSFDEVYQLQVSFFPLTQFTNKKSKKGDSNENN